MFPSSVQFIVSTTIIFLVVLCSSSTWLVISANLAPGGAHPCSFHSISYVSYHRSLPPTSMPPPQLQLTGKIIIEMGDSDYNNCKQLRRESSLYDQARSPQEIISSIYNDFSWSLGRDLILTFACFLFGVYGPKTMILPLIGGLTMRQIPYQVTAAGDVIVDLALANELIPKSEVTFRCELQTFGKDYCTCRKLQPFD